MSKSKIAIDFLIDLETGGTGDGYVNDSDDRGGESKYGISKRSYPHLDIKNLTREDAENIYLSDWWTKYQYEWIDSVEISKRVLALCVVSGPRMAHKILQKALNLCFFANLKVDGILGEKTFNAVNSISNDVIITRKEVENEQKLLRAYSGLAMIYHSKCKTAWKHKTGWWRRDIT